MNTPRPTGPFDNIRTPGGDSVPLYLIPFDKDGRCVGPKTLEHMLASAAGGQFTDIHVYSHGWNNVFKEALAHYTEFFTEYFQLRDRTHISRPANYKPLLVGIIWPSTALVGGDEQTPKFAAAPALARAEAMDNELFAKTELAKEIPDAQVPRFLELAEQDRPLTRDEALEFARMLLPLYEREAADREGIAEAVTPEKLVKAWEDAQRPAAAAETGAPGVIPDDDEPAPARGQIRTAGLLDFLNPREIIRGATVYQMKDRAGTVGARGVGPMLRDLLTRTTARVHLTGHSYGGKVMLSALSFVQHPRHVTSLLLLQPAVNTFCFAEKIAEHGGQPGGFRVALDRVERPVFTTFSSHDSPLTRFFQIALRRDGDLGEVRPAGAPSKYAALGGFGPSGLRAGESITIPILGPPNFYAIPAGVRLCALDGSNNRIMSHGDVRNEFTEWALVNLVAGSE